MHTPQEIAAACREAAEWVRDPDSPKVAGLLAVDADGRGLLSNDYRAVKWCALGRLGHLLDLQHPATAVENSGVGCMHIATTFNTGVATSQPECLEKSACLLEDVAEYYEAQIVTTEERQLVLA